MPDERQDKGKKVLILGNGFDLAHKLPVHYGDFLCFCKKIEIKNAQHMNEFNNHVIKKLLKYLYKNIWYRYFHLLNNGIISGKNWIDFENEISIIIQVIDRNEDNLLVSMEHFVNEFKNEKLNINSIERSRMLVFIILLYRDFKWPRKERANLELLRERSLKDLERLIRALEIYLSCFVEKLLDESIPKLNYIEELNPDYVINFNYTHTYEKIYGKNDVFHVHGYCDRERNAKNNNMVLGIDEYWSDEECDSHINFSIFKKFVQRIMKKTGTDNYKYLKEIDRIYKNENKSSEVYIFGHSLDVTDKDILKGFLESDATIVTIYCMNKEVEGELIANVIKLIGEKCLLKKVNQEQPKIKFIIPDSKNN